ncbi:MAG: NAD(+) kinase [Gammaproteobacteria bacterium]|nr:NAD(+) kinase [Gammaproteobacteria bacterium]
MTAKKPFQRVVLYARQQRDNEDVIETMQQVFTHLRKRFDVFIDTDTADCCDFDIPVLEHQALNADQDVMLVVGGDGSMLSAAQIAIRHNIPVIGINRGHLGFLTDVSPQEFATQLDAVLDGHYLSEARTLIHMRIQEDTTTHFEADALNDVVLSRGDETRLITFDVFINEQFVSHYRADGLIVATPTGSTAYALSAGGPILHPQLNAMTIVPMFSHSFSARPLVIDENSQINIRISSPNDIPLRLSCDGHQSYAIDPGQYVSIEKSFAQLQLLHPQEYRYYDTLRIKLGWGSEG